MLKRCIIGSYEHSNKKTCRYAEQATREVRPGSNEMAVATPSEPDVRLSYPSPETTPPRTSPQLSDIQKPSSHYSTPPCDAGVAYKLPPAWSTQVELRKSSVCGGHGLFAMRDFAQGDLVFVEAPWLSVPVRGDVDSVPSNEEIAAAIEAAIDADVSNEARYHFLHPQQTNNDLVLRTKRDKKFEMNCWQTTQPRLDANGVPVLDVAGRPLDEHHRRIGYLLSTPNHSCSPDIQPTWRPAEQHWVVHALRAIKRGEELFVNYDQAKDWNLRAHRQLALDFSHAFRCACRVCMSLDAEVRRMQYQGYRRALTASDARKVKAAGDFVVAARLSHDAWSLLWRDLDALGPDCTRPQPGWIPRRVSPRYIEACEDLARRSIDAYIDLAGKHPELIASTDFGRRLFRQGALVYESAEEAYVVCYGADDPNVAGVKARHDSHWQTLLRACRGSVPVGYFDSDEFDPRRIGERWRHVQTRSLVVRLKVRSVDEIRTTGSL